MKKFFPLLLLLLLTTIAGLTQKPRILLDGYFTDWENRPNSFNDPIGDGRFGYDFTSLVIENDEAYIYFYFETSLDINIQENNDIALVLDTDNDYSTGYPIDNLGAEMIYFFGDRSGAFYSGNNQYSIEHNDIGLITLPSISSEIFEIGINRNAEVNGNALFPQNSFKAMLFQDVQNGDKLPDQSGGVVYSFTDGDLTNLPPYSIKKHTAADFRVLSYNVLQDNIFERQNEFQRQLSAIDPDIIAFQEIYDHSAAQTKALVESWIGGNWYAAKQGSDIITISRYPILESHYVAGNGAFLLDVNGHEVLLINAHLPCCDNDAGRQGEVDQIMAFIRDAKSGNSSLSLKDKTPIILAGDMNFVGKNRQLQTFLKGDIQNEFLHGPDFSPDWDETGFIDALPFMNKTPLAITWYNSYSDYNPGRLDYIIFSDAVLALHNTFNLFTGALPQDSLNTYTLLKNDTGYSSDHLPVVADFEIDYTNTVESVSHENYHLTNVFPVPFTNHLNIQWMYPNKATSFVSIYDMNGYRMYVKKCDGIISQNIDTEWWPEGNYYLILKQEDKIQQMVINKIN